MDAEDPTDAAQSRRGKTSDEALQILVQNHRAFLGFLERRVGSHETAEDLLQEAFGRAVTHLDGLRDKESAVAWFYRLLRNAVTDHYRRTAVSSGALERFAAELSEAVPAPEVRGEICGCVTRLTATLKPEYAEALKRVEIDGLSVKAYAEEQGISTNNAGVRVFRARDALRKQVVASCGTCAEHGCRDCTCGGGRPRRTPFDPP